MATSRFATALLLLLFLIGCGGDVEKEIVGEWRGLTAKQDLAFHSDGSVVMKGHRHNAYEGRYVIEESDRLTCIFDRLSRPVECTAKIRGDQLTLAFSTGREEEYERK